MGYTFIPAMETGTADTARQAETCYCQPIDDQPRQIGWKEVTLAIDVALKSIKTRRPASIDH
jgi:hypothetical protein